MKLNTDVRIRVNSNAEKLAALEILSAVYDQPVEPGSRRLALDGIKTGCYYVSGGEYIGIGICSDCISGYTGSGDNKTFNFSEIDKAIKFIKEKKEIEVKLNDEYTAKVSKTEIRVGRQIFPISILEGLNDARAELEG